MLLSDEPRCEPERPTGCPFSDGCSYKDLAAFLRGLLFHQLKAALVYVAPADDFNIVLRLRDFKHRHCVLVASLYRHLIGGARD